MLNSSTGTKFAYIHCKQYSRLKAAVVHEANTMDVLQPALKAGGEYLKLKRLGGVCVCGIKSCSVRLGTIWTLIHITNFLQVLPGYRDIIMLQAYVQPSSCKLIMFTPGTVIRQ